MLRFSGEFKKQIHQSISDDLIEDNNSVIEYNRRNLGLSDIEKMSFCAWITDEKYRDTFKAGAYTCSKCGYELFSSRTKFKHFSPWPSFTETVHEDSVSKRKESFRPSLTYKVSCGKCGQGLGHEFVGDGPGGRSRF